MTTARQGFLKKAVDADPRPAFEFRFAAILDRREAEEPSVGQSLLARADIGSIELIQMNDSEMDPSDGRLIVVDQPDASDPPRAADLDLFLDLATHRGLVGIEGLAAERVLLGDMPAHSERSEPMQPRLALRSSPGCNRTRRPRNGTRRRG